MMAKVIKLTDNSAVTLLPITDSAYVQHKWKEGATGGTTITSVRNALNNVIDRVDGVHASGSDNQHLTGTGTALASANNSSVAYINLDGNGGNVGIQGTAGTSATNQVGQADVTVSYDTVSGQPNNIRIKVSYRDTNTDHYDKITPSSEVTSGMHYGRGLKIFNVATVGTATGSTTGDYYVPTATESVLGVVKSSITGQTPYRYYKVQVDDDGTMNVNVPWTDTVPNYSDTYAPKAHAHGNITNDGKINGSMAWCADRVVVTDSSAKIAVSTNITTTELDCLNNVTSNIQTQIDNINTTISSGMHMRGTTTTVPATNVAYTVGDSYVWNNTNTGTLPAAQSQSGDNETISKGDMITYVATGKWAVIQNNLTLSFENPTIPANGTTIQYVHYNGTDYMLKHGTPTGGTALTANAEGTGTATAVTSASYIPVVTGISVTQSNGHVTGVGVTTKGLKISYTDTNTHKLSYNIVGAASGMTNSAQTTNGNVNLRHIEGIDGSFTATSTHKITGAGGVSVTSDVSGTITITGPGAKDNNYSKVAISTQASSTSTDAAGGTAVDLVPASSADKLNIESVNKWVQVKGTSGGANSDKIQFAHALKGTGGTAALKKIAWDEAGHIGASADVTITKNLYYDVYPSDVDFTLPLGDAESPGNTIVTNIS